MNIALSNSHDIYFNTDGSLAMVTDENELVTQQVKCLLLTNTGEWFLDNTVGIPYFDYIFDAGDEKIIKNIIYSKIINIENVISVNILSIEVKLRSMTIILNINNSKNIEIKI